MKKNTYKTIERKQLTEDMKLYPFMKAVGPLRVGHTDDSNCISAPDLLYRLDTLSNDIDVYIYQNNEWIKVNN